MTETIPEIVISEMASWADCENSAMELALKAAEAAGYVLAPIKATADITLSLALEYGAVLPYGDNARAAKQAGEAWAAAIAARPKVP